MVKKKGVKEIRLTVLKTTIFILIVIGAQSAVAQTPKKIQEKYTLFWSDDFNGDTIDTTKWNYRATGALRQFATVSEDNCFLDGEGHLIIQTTKKDSTYYVGQIATDHTLMTRYGYFECRAKVNNQQGPISAFWLQSPTIQLEINDPKKAGAEIDIVEYHTRKGLNDVHHTVHWNGYGEKRKHVHKRKKVKGVSDGYHTFGLEWTEKKYIFYVDGKRTWSTCRGVSGIEEFIILSMDLMTPGGDFSQSTFPDQVMYDYVRVFKRKGKDEKVD